MAKLQEVTIEANLGASQDGSIARASLSPGGLRITIARSDSIKGITLDSQEPKTGAKKRLDSVMDFACGTGKLYTFHVNALRSIMEKTASFFGHADISFCLKALDNEEDLALYNRALNLLSHGKYAIHEPTEMGEDTKALFRRILEDFTTKFQFELPDILAAAPVVQKELT
jgi:hypothetical protein